MEDNDIDDHEDMRENSEDNVEGDDLMEDFEKDYAERPELDRYDHEGIDDESHQELSMGQRIEIDEQLA